MKDTRATRISATVFRKHKYITNPSVTPEDRVMATVGKFVDDLKGRMATHLRKIGYTPIGAIGDHYQAGMGPYRKYSTAPSNSKQTSLHFAKLRSD